MSRIIVSAVIIIGSIWFLSYFFASRTKRRHKKLMAPIREKRKIEWSKNRRLILTHSGQNNKTTSKIMHITLTARERKESVGH